MSVDATSDAAQAVGAVRRGGWLGDKSCHLLFWLADRLARKAGLGRMDVTLPGGRRGLIGAANGNVPVLEFKTWMTLRDVMLRGSLGFADAYLKGDIAVADLDTLFEFVLDHEPALTWLVPRLYHATPGVRRYHQSRANTRSRSRENIAVHYDLGNEFYAAWLDPTMLYSSGIYRRADDTLENAQEEKLSRIFSALDVVPGASLLEIGCGWGQVALEAARRGGRVKAATISAAQKAWTDRRVSEAGLTSSVDVAFEDYRDLTGTYDHIVSIEMIEAVGEENWPAYFATIAERLRPGGTAILQAITIDEPLFDHYRHNPDFIQRYIFPGGMLPSVPRMETEARAAGLRFETVERFGQSYARTLADWRVRFEAAWPGLSRQGRFDERFRRMWLYYLTYCEVGFRRRFIDVGLYRLTRDVR